MSDSDYKFPQSKFSAWLYRHNRIGRVLFVISGVPLWVSAAFLIYGSDIGRLTFWSAAILSSLLMALALVWAFWVEPCILAGHPHMPWIGTPRQIRQKLVTTIWLPPLGLLVTAVLLPPAAWALDHLEPGRPIFPDFIGPYYSLILISTAALMIPICWRVQAIARRRFMREVELRHMCFHCGADLGDNPDATGCSECGWAIAWKKAP